MRGTLALLVLFAWMFALTFIGLGALGFAVVDLALWLDHGGAAGAVHFAVALALVLGRRGRRISSHVAI